MATSARKFIVVLEFENPLGSDEQEIAYTLMDALAEFQSARFHNGEQYVDKRYGYDGNPYPDGPRRVMKITQVNRRIFLAEQMRNSIKQIRESRNRLYYVTFANDWTTLQISPDEETACKEAIVSWHCWWTEDPPAIKEVRDIGEAP